MSTTHDGKPRPADPPPGAVTGCAALTVFALVTVVFATKSTIADPDVPWMLDVVGLDDAAPTVIADFSRGGLGGGDL